MGCTIEVKVLGILKLESKEYLVIDDVLPKGKIDLRSILIGTYFTYHFIRNWWAPLWLRETLE